MFWRVDIGKKKQVVVEAETAVGAQRVCAEQLGRKSTSRMGTTIQWCSVLSCSEHAVVKTLYRTFEGPSGAIWDLIQHDVSADVSTEFYLCSTHNRRFQQSIFTRLRELEERMDDLEEAE